MNIKHKLVWLFIRPLVIIFLWFKFGYTFKTAKGLPENYIVLANHTTDFDPVFVGASFRKLINSSSGALNPSCDTKAAWRLPR